MILQTFPFQYLGVMDICHVAIGLVVVQFLKVWDESLFNDKLSLNLG